MQQLLQISLIIYIYSFYNYNNMTGLGQVIEQTARKVESGDVSDLKEGLNLISKISKQQLQANQREVATPIQNFTEAVERNIKLNDNKITQSQPIRSAIRTITSHLPSQIRKQVLPIVRNIDRQARKAEMMTDIQKSMKQRNDFAQELVQNSAVQLSQLSAMSTNKISLQDPIDTSPIQQSVLPYRRILDLSPPNPVRQNQLPQTMRLLTNYAQIKGRIPIGSISHSNGSAYVGLQTVMYGDHRQILPFQRNTVVQTNIPSIASQLQYHANKTINAWNDYVSEQSQFIGFYQKINSIQKRKKFIQSQFQTMNFQTFSAQAIATLVHYYIYLPFLKIAYKASFDSSIQVSLQGYLKIYQLPGQRVQNPMLLSSNMGKAIATFLFSVKNKTPDQVFVDIKAIMENDTSFLKDQILKVTTYVERKGNEAKSFMQQNGIQKQNIARIMTSPDWSSVKTKKFVVTNGMKNPQLNEIARSIIVKNNQAKNIQYLQMNFTSSQILSHDYIWGWSRR